MEKQKKRVLIVDCDAKIGGIQKARTSLLKQIADSYDVTLLLLYKSGPLLQEIPSNVRIVETKSHFKYMGMSQADCVSLHDKLIRGTYAIISKLCGRKLAVKLACLTLYRDAQEEYDVAVSYSHIVSDRLFFSGSSEYVLFAAKAASKLCYIHCDYLNSGNRSAYSDRMYPMFDGIICVSQSTRERFVEALPDMKSKTFAVLNSIDKRKILNLSAQHAIVYDSHFINLLSVARFTYEKGILRFIRILSEIDTSNIHYTIVGDGTDRPAIEREIDSRNLNGVVTLSGEDDNPYRYMVHADLLIVPSYHEAAPVVFQEAKALNLPIFTTRTTSADEMVGNRYGYVVENDDNAIAEKIREILNNPKILKSKKNEIASLKYLKKEEFSFTDVVDKLTEGSSYAVKA